MQGVGYCLQASPCTSVDPPHSLLESLFLFYNIIHFSAKTGNLGENALLCVYRLRVIIFKINLYLVLRIDGKI